MLLGSPGSGKTLLGLHFLAEGARLGERVHYFAFHDPPQRACEQTAKVGLRLEPFIEKDLFELSFHPPMEHALDELGVQLLALIRERGVRRLFVDGFDALRKAVVHPPRISRFMAALVQECRARGVTMLFTVETESLFGLELKLPVRGVSMLCENIILTRCTELTSELRRFIYVLKMRTSDHDHTLREFHIRSKGLEIGKPLVDAQLSVTGLSMQSPSKGKTRKARPKRRGK
jgi:circadian clock protein KaiC